MLDTKLKNRHRLVVCVLVAVITCLAALAVVGKYDGWYANSDEQIEEEYKEMLTSKEFLEKFVEMPYVLYNSQGSSILTERAINEQLDDLKVSYDRFYPYVVYAAFDEFENRIESMSSENISSTDITGLKTYKTAVILRYYEGGEPFIQVVRGEYQNEREIILRSIANEREDIQNNYDVNIHNKNGDVQTVSLKAPRNCTFVIAMTEENQNLFLNEEWGIGKVNAPASMIQWVMAIVLIVAAFAWILPRFSYLQTGNEKLFHVPFEIAGIVMGITVGKVLSYEWNSIISYGSWWWYDLLIWMTTFVVAYWASGCFRLICDLGVKSYFKEKTLIGVCGNKFIKIVKIGWSRVVHSIEGIDFTKKNSKTLLKVVIVNGVILTIICILGKFGLIMIIAYSIILFLILIEFYKGIQEKYSVLLSATNEIAEGNLEREIEENLGVFHPLKNEITKIQAGFKNAIEKEVKSQRMKTELITNVSHDLKTPLTSIITYVNLLKDEKDEEKRKEYIEVLDKKSLRLKVLIEDLFEISKASSKNVSLNILDVDIVSLFKQVKLETEEEFAGTGLEFRCNYSEEPVISPLDSQKTYRIFENLLVNVAKYAMPNTRVYVDIQKEGEKAVVRMKNISAAELKFDSNEITERFVRGDEARNTEGTGLGLAIVKSFTEVQKGEFKIEIDGDVFKVEVKF